MSPEEEPTAIRIQSLGALRASEEEKWIGSNDDDDLDCGVEDAAEADGVLEEAVDVEDGGVGAGVGDVVDVRDHIVAHPRCGASPPEIATPLSPERITDRAHLCDDHGMRPGKPALFGGVFLFYVFVFVSYS